MDFPKKGRDGNDFDARFGREELGALLRLFSSLGITVAVGILGFFLLGLWLDRKFAAWGWQTYGAPRIVCVLLGVGLAVYWAYLRIARHLDKYEPRRRDEEGEDSGSDT